MWKWRWDGLTRSPEYKEWSRLRQQWHADHPGQDCNDPDCGVNPDCLGNILAQRRDKS